MDVTAVVSEETLAQDRQRLFLERTTEDLKTKLNSDLNATKANRMRIMHVNTNIRRRISMNIFICRRKILFYFKS